jgi:hypothetical protein
VLAIAPRDSAIGPLLAGLRLVPRERASLRLRYVDALCKLKDARALPELIGLLESAADPVTGERIDQALCQLTGVSAPRAAAWWRQWWDENQRRLPAGVKATPIPDYSETQR